MKLRFLSKLKQFRWSKLLLIWLVFLLIAGVLFAERCGIKYAFTTKLCAVSMQHPSACYAMPLLTLSLTVPCSIWTIFLLLFPAVMAPISAEITA